jgi:hypothetical protein
LSLSSLSSPPPPPPPPPPSSSSDVSASLPWYPCSFFSAFHCLRWAFFCALRIWVTDIG